MNQTLIKVVDLDVAYPNGHLALENVNLELRGGSICALVGMNGAGKTTLFKAIMGFIKPSKGTVSLAGMDVTSALKKSVVSYVPQSEDVDWNFPILVEDLVMMGRYGHMNFMRIPSLRDRKISDAALERVGMSEYRKRQIGELSGGQKKRAFVARTLAHGGQVILLDEPFTGIDAKTETSLIELFQELAAEGRLILISTHNLGSVPSFCTNVVLVNKTVLGCGPIQETFTAENLALTFGGVLKHVHIGTEHLHVDGVVRTATILSDDEHPLILYGDAKPKQVVSHQDEES
jgi:manganese/iron transport system ATP-binding protein